MENLHSYVVCTEDLNCRKVLYGCSRSLADSHCSKVCMSMSEYVRPLFFFFLRTDFCRKLKEPNLSLYLKLYCCQSYLHLYVI